ncbi:CBS domain-containing protein [Nocardiopsis suaedae]|uniref:CBS domain-containing protein n=1 Tax=Nocardiopsis suaedae TaxID=3018444 RepID=A0ABT4TQB6_9ACTN|nr:CBS domain-containing protein [Nocardiopsis suaedae]MDA2806878.1 CBS domain-containing protein [Nocardiopsis suaedae]
MLVDAVMTAPRAVLSAEATVSEAARLFVERGVAAAPVLDGSGGLLGIVTEIDLLRERYEYDPRASARPVAEPPAPLAERVSDVMTREVVTVTENTDAARLVDLMVRDRIRWVPVVRAGRVVGMVGRGDLLRMQWRPDAETTSDLRSALAEGAPYLHWWTAEVRDGVAYLDCRGAGPEECRTAEGVARTVAGVGRVVVDA